MFQNTGLETLPGDSVSVICPNPEVEVNALLERLQISSDRADLPFELSISANATKKNAKIPDYLPIKHSTLRHVFTHVLDIRSVPKKVNALPNIP